MTETHGLTTCRNEAHRYLQSCLAWNCRFLDTTFVYDDQSTDGSVAVAETYAEVVVRPDGVASFLEHEGAFRQAAWDAWEAVIEPRAGDLVLAFDLDETWCGPALSEIDALLPEGASGMVRRPEMFSLDIPLKRVDGFWDTLKNIRIFRYEPGGRFRQKILAGGSHPSYAEANPIDVPGYLLHYGYADRSDRHERYQRYINRPGHSKRHMRSITQSPKLSPFNADWPLPKVWRGQNYALQEEVKS